MADEQIQTPANPAAESAKAAPVASAPVMVQLSVEEYQRYRGVEGEFNQFKAAKQVELEAKEAERIKALTDKGEVDKALERLNKANADKLNEANQRYSELEQQTYAERKATVVAQALAGRTFVSAKAAKQAEALIADSVEVVRNADKTLSVHDKITRRPAVDTLKEMLDSEDFAHFLAASSTSGGTAQQGNRNVAQKTDAPPPGSLEAIAAAFKARQAEYGSIGLQPFAIAQ